LNVGIERSPLGLPVARPASEPTRPDGQLAGA
jgi:hypothetical protein